MPTIKQIQITEDEIVADLVDGRTISPLPGRGDYLKLHPNSGQTMKSLEMGRGSIGLMLMKILALKECYTERLPDDRS